MPMRRFTTLLLYAVLLGVALRMLVPFGYMLLSRFGEGGDNGPPLLDWAGGLAAHWERFTLDNFRRLFAAPLIGRSLLNSVFIVSMTSPGATLVTAMGGYALARFNFRGREALNHLGLGALVIPAPLMIATGYQWLYQVGLLDTHSGLLFPAMGKALGVFLFRQSMLNAVPAELIVAARINGAGEFRIFSASSCRSGDR